MSNFVFLEQPAGQMLWTNEENGLRGARNYAKVHADELANHVAAIESDGGVFRPTGFSLDCKDEKREAVAADQVRDILSLFSRFDATALNLGHTGADIGPMRDAGVVLMGHRVDGSKYFYYHHSPADTLDKVDPEELSQNVAVLATLAYVLADMPQRLGSTVGSSE